MFYLLFIWILACGFLVIFQSALKPFVPDWFVFAVGGGGLFFIWRYNYLQGLIWKNFLFENGFRKIEVENLDPEIKSLNIYKEAILQRRIRSVLKQEGGELSTWVIVVGPDTEGKTGTTILVSTGKNNFPLATIIKTDLPTQKSGPVARAFLEKMFKLTAGPDFQALKSLPPEDARYVDLPQCVIFVSDNFPARSVFSEELCSLLREWFQKKLGAITLIQRYAILAVSGDEDMFTLSAEVLKNQWQDHLLMKQRLQQILSRIK